MIQRGKIHEVAIPRVWGEPSDHTTNCYFCMVDPFKHRTRRNAPSILYPDIPSSIALVPNSADLPVLTPPARSEPSEEESSISKDTEGSEED